MTLTIDPEVAAMFGQVQCSSAKIDHHIFSDNSQAASVAADVQSSAARSADLNVSPVDPVQPTNTVSIQQDASISLN